MPIVELDDGRRVETDDTSPEAIDEIAGHLGAAPTGQSPSGAYPQPGADVSITGALKQSASDIYDALGDVLRPPAEALDRLTRPTGESSIGGALGDVGTVAGTALMPEVAAAQVGVGAATRSIAPEKAQAAETATGVLGTGAEAVAGGVGAVNAWRAGRSAAPIEAGTNLQATVPRAAESLRKDVQAKFYDPVAEYMATSGKALEPGSAEATNAADTIEAAENKWGKTAAGQKVLSQLRGASEAGPPAPTTYADLDAAMRALPGRAKEARGAVQKAIDSLVKDTPAQAKLAAGREAWAMEVAPARRLASKVSRAGSPESALAVLYRGLDARANAETAAKLYGGAPEDWNTILSGIKEATGSARAAHAGEVVGGVAGTAAGASTGIYAIPGMLFGAHHGMRVGARLGPAVRYAALAMRAFTGGMGRAGAAALADTISAWGDGQDETTRAGAAGVAAALRSGEQNSPSTAGSPLGTPAQTAQSPLPSGVPFDREATRVAQVVGVDPQLLHSVMTMESGHNPHAVSRDAAGNPIAYGLMQLTPPTFETVRPQVESLVGRHADINNPWDNLTAGALLYHNYLARTGGNVEQAARYYHGGLDSRAHGPKTIAYGKAVAADYARKRSAAFGG